MTEAAIEIRPISEDVVEDRLALCWGHVDGWRDRDVVDESRAWLENVNRAFSPTTFIAYRAGDPVGMIEFAPTPIVDRFGLVPCRAAPERACWSAESVPDAASENAIFVACLWVEKASQGEGVGRALLGHLLESEVVRDYDGIYTVVSDRDAEFVDPDEGIWWPTGPREFFESFGFEAVDDHEDAPCSTLYRAIEE